MGSTLSAFRIALLSRLNVGHTTPICPVILPPDRIQVTIEPQWWSFTSYKDYFYSWVSFQTTKTKRPIWMKLKYYRSTFFFFFFFPLMYQAHMLTLNTVLLATTCLHFVSQQKHIKLKLLMNVTASLVHKRKVNMLHSLCTCIWMLMFITIALCPVSPICVSLLRMVYKWQSSYAYCISFVCFTRSDGLFKQNGEETATLVIWNLQWLVLITVILFVEGSRIYTGFKTNSDIPCFSYRHCDGWFLQ